MIYVSSPVIPSGIIKIWPWTFRLRAWCDNTENVPRN